MGTWLVEDIENEVVTPGNVAIFGLDMVYGLKHQLIQTLQSLWCGNGKRTHGDGKIKRFGGGRQCSQTFVMYHL